jgi:hypothetical protein
MVCSNVKWAADAVIGVMIRIRCLLSAINLSSRPDGVRFGRRSRRGAGTWRIDGRMSVRAQRLVNTGGGKKGGPRQGESKPVEQRRAGSARIIEVNFFPKKNKKRRQTTSAVAVEREGDR